MIYDFFKQLLQPYTLLCVLSTLGLVVHWRSFPKDGRRRRYFAVPFLLLLLISWPPFSYLALGTLEWQNPPTAHRPPDAQAIVVLNAGISYPDSARKEAELEPDTMLRCMQAAKVYHQGPALPVIVTGGTEFGLGKGPSCAAVMRDAMLRMGVADKDILLEEKSLTTYENAVEASRILRDLELTKVIVVTDASHLPRSLLCFQKQGLDPVPSGCRYRASQLKIAPKHLLPNPNAALDVIRACHEWSGTLWYWCRGRI